MAVELFAGVPVNDHRAALAWYEKLFGSAPNSNGVRKVTYQDPDGNEVGFGGAPI